MQPKLLQGFIGIPSFLDHFNIWFIFQKSAHAMAD
jgi:hypothetical protein